MKRRVVLSGIGCLSAAGAGAEALRAALAAGAALARPHRLELGGGEWVQVRAARLPEIDRTALLSPAQRRRMSLLSQDWVISCLLARADAGLQSASPSPMQEPSHGMPPPMRSAVCLGTAFGGLECTAAYLEGIGRDGLGLGNPFLFSESVANAPAGHAAIALDCRGLNVSLTCGDASGVAAVDCGARAIRDGRADMAFAGGVEEMTSPLMTVLARLGVAPIEAAEWRRRGPRRTGSSRSPAAGGSPAAARTGARPPAPAAVPAPGEGAACFLLEERERALARGVTPYAEIHPARLVSDPGAGATEWSRSVRPRVEALGAALREAEITPADLSGAVLHACGDPEADSSEEEAVFRGIAAERGAEGSLPTLRPSRILGTFAAAGAFSVAAAALALRHPDLLSSGVPSARSGEAGRARHILLSAASWGGSCLGVVLSRSDG